MARAYMPPRKSWAKRFWEALSTDKLLLQNCAQCRTLTYPPAEQHCLICCTEKIWCQRPHVSAAIMVVDYVPSANAIPIAPRSPPYTAMLVTLFEGVQRARNSWQVILNP